MTAILLPLVSALAVLVIFFALLAIAVLRRQIRRLEVRNSDALEGWRADWREATRR